MEGRLLLSNYVQFANWKLRILYHVWIDGIQKASEVVPRVGFQQVTKMGWFAMGSQNKAQKTAIVADFTMIDATAIYIYICIISCIYNKWIQMKPSHGFNALLGIIEPWLNHRIRRLGGSPRSARATLTEALTDSYHGNNSTSSLQHIQTTYCSLIWLKSGSSCSCWCFMINPNYRAAGQRRAVGAIAGQGWSSELVTKG